MAALVIVLALGAVVAALAAGRWIGSRRRDDLSIQAHRSALGVIEHAAGAEPADRPPCRSTGHVRIVAAEGRAAGAAPPRPTPAGYEDVLPRRPPRPPDRPSFPRPKPTQLKPPAGAGMTH